MPEASKLPTIAHIGLSDLKAALNLGWRDFKHAPQFGLFFAAVYVLIGFGLTLTGAGTVLWTLALALAFPLFAPFATVGLYEVSHKIESDQPLEWASILGAVWREKDRQIPSMGAIIVFYVLFWSFLAHMIFAIFLGISTITNISTSMEIFTTPNGLAMIAVELGVGAVLAFLLFALTMTSLPHLVDKEVDFITAMIFSVRAVAQNFKVVFVWASLIGICTLLALAPLFLGLFVVLPVFGHATWHLYRRVLV